MRPGSVLLGLGAIVLLAGCGGTAREAAAPAERSARESAQEREYAAAFAAEGWKTDFGKRTVPLGEILSGGPPKDGIPAVDAPRFIPVSKVGFLEPQEPVIELVVDGEARAYPLQILIWHEIVNDEIAGVPVAITFCPLCNTAIVFDRRVDGETLDFGTTGKLRNADLVMYDRQTESWWQQFGGEGIVGRYTGTRLEELPARIVAWREFARGHRGGLVLSRETGYSRAYGQNPYQGYDDVDTPPFFPAANPKDKRLPPKERVVYIERGGEAVAVPFPVLAERRVVHVVVAGHRLVVRWRGGVASALDSPVIAQGREVGAAEVLENGKPVPFSEPFWFSVAAFRPDVKIVGR